MSNSFCEQLIESFESRPNATAMRIVGSDEATYTWAEMHERIRSVSYRLRQEGVEFGDRVALIGENHPKWAIAYLGTLMIGAVIVPLDPHGEPDTITNFLVNSEAKVAFLSPDQIKHFAKVEEKLGRAISKVVWNLDEEAVGFEHFEDWAATEFPVEFAAETPPARGDDMAVLMYTSGTTGTPKGVPLTHGNIIAELEGVNLVINLSDKDKILSLLPLFHAYLQIVNMWIATKYGCEVGYLKELTPDELSKAMKEFKPTILTTVPRLWYLFHKKIFDGVKAKPALVQRLFKVMLATNGVLRDTLGINLGHRMFGAVHDGFGGDLRVAISAGSRFDEDVAIDFHRLGFTILQGYGLTETSGAATATYEDDNRVGSVGKAMQGIEIKINEPDKDGVGEVLIKGPMVFKGYYQNPTANAEAFTEDGYFRSGDLGKLVDGHLYIVGRGKDVIVLPSGKNVHPEDLEVHYLKCPLVAELAIIGIADESEGRDGAEKLAAVVVPDFDYLKQAKIANSKEAIRHALDSLGRELPEYWRVRDYIIRQEILPRTATRKIKRFQLKKEIESGEVTTEAKETKTWELSSGDELMLQTPTAKAVIAAIRQNAKDGDVIHPSMSLELDLGLDSLARAETFAALEQAFSTEFDGDEAATALTVANVIELVNKHGGETAEIASVDLNWGKIVRETDDKFPEVEGILQDRPIFGAFAFSIYKIFWLIFKIFLRLEVTGRENLTLKSEPPALVGGVDDALTNESNGKALSVQPPASAGGSDRKIQSFIIAPNHQSFLDPFVICSNYPFALFKNIFHVGASEFFSNTLTKYIAKLLNVVPVNPDTELMRAMKAGAIGLKHGKVLNIYPEGERAFDGELHGFKKGAAILAAELDVPIVPIAIDGLYKVWPRNSYRIRPGKVKMMIGKPFYAKDVPGGDTHDDAAYTAITAHLKTQIESMIEEMRR